MLSADKQVFPKLDIVGWYATGEDIQEADMLIHRKVYTTSHNLMCFTRSASACLIRVVCAMIVCSASQVMELNESPVFLLFHTHQNVVRKDLPVSLYESGKRLSACHAALPYCKGKCPADKAAQHCYITKFSLSHQKDLCRAPCG